MIRYTIEPALWLLLLAPITCFLVLLLIWILMDKTNSYSEFLEYRSRIQNRYVVCIYVFICYIALCGYFYSWVGEVALGRTTFQFNTFDIFVAVTFSILFVGVIFIFFLTTQILVGADILVLTVLIIAVVGLCFCRDLLTMYLLIEMCSMCFCILVCVYNGDKREVGLKYILFSLISSGLFLLGFLLLYSYNGSLLLSELRFFYRCSTSNDVILYEVGIGLLALSMLFKVGAAPFHNWLVDVYEKCSSATFVLLVVIVKPVFLFVFFRLFEEVFVNSAVVHWFAIIVAFFCLYHGTLGAVYTRSVQIMLAYSGIVSVGYFLLGFGGSYFCPDLPCSLAAFLYIIFYAFACWFFCLLLYLTSVPFFTSIDEFKGMFLTQPLLALGFVVSLTTFMGLPPFMGFVFKLLLITSLFLNYAFSFSVLIMITSVITCFYYLRIIKIMGIMITSREKHQIINSRDLTEVQTVVVILTIILNLSVLFCYWYILETVGLFYILFI